MNETKPRVAKTFEALLRSAVESRLTDVHTCLPAEVLSFDAARVEVKVQPLIKRIYPDGAVDLPIIHRVPVVYPRSGLASITFPLTAGDTVLLLFSERSLEVWKDDGGNVDPEDTRKFDLSDAIAIPGLFPSTDPVEVAADALTATCGSSTLTLKEDGTITAANDAVTMTLTAAGKLSIVKAGVDFIAQVLAVFDKAMASKVATQMGLQSFIPDPTYPVERAKLDPFKV